MQIAVLDLAQRLQSGLDQTVPLRLLEDYAQVVRVAVQPVRDLPAVQPPPRVTLVQQQKEDQGTEVGPVKLFLPACHFFTPVRRARLAATRG